MDVECKWRKKEAISSEEEVPNVKRLKAKSELKRRLSSFSPFLCSLKLLVFAFDLRSTRRLQLTSRALSKKERKKAQTPCVRCMAKHAWSRRYYGPTILSRPFFVSQSFRFSLDRTNEWKKERKGLSTFSLPGAYRSIAFAALHPLASTNHNDIFSP